VRGFGRYGHVELDVSDDSGVRKKFGKYDTIWIEREFLERVEGQCLKARFKRNA
jgi:hypothetical protein